MTWNATWKWWVIVSLLLLPICEVPMSPHCNISSILNIYVALPFKEEKDTGIAFSCNVVELLSFSFSLRTIPTFPTPHHHWASTFIKILANLLSHASLLNLYWSRCSNCYKNYIIQQPYCLTNLFALLYDSSIHPHFKS